VYIGITKQNPIERWRNGEGYKGQIFYRAIKNMVGTSLYMKYYLQY
jgi:hypothetical protein